MEFFMKTIEINELSKNLQKIVGSIVKHDEIVKVLAKTSNVVLISEQNYRSLIESIYLLSQPKLISKIKDGEKEDISKMKKFNPEEFESID